MRIPRTLPDPSTEPDAAADLRPPTTPTGGTARSSTAATPRTRRAPLGRARQAASSTQTGLPPKELETHIDLTGRRRNFWVGLAMLHTLFTREHNAICDELPGDASGAGRRPAALRQGAPGQRRADGEDPHGGVDAGDHRPPDVGSGMRANWWGLAGRAARQALRPATSSEVISGIPGSPTNHHGVPYSLTEEFVAVYRMHPLIPDDYSFRSLAGDAPLQERTLDGARRAPRRANGWSEIADGRSLLLVRHVASRARSRSTTTRGSSSTSTAPTDDASTSRRSTSSAPASGECRATTSSAGCST